MSPALSDYSQGAAPLRGCFWGESVPDHAFDCPVLVGQSRVDVAIIGGGFTGLSAALHLAQDGVEVAVLEAQFPGWGASGRNGGFCCLGGAKASGKRLERLGGGPKARLAFRHAEREAVSVTEDLIEAYGLSVDRHSNGETILAHTPRAMNRLRAEKESIKAEYGVVALLAEAADLPALGMNGPFHGALTIPIGFGLNPRKYLLGLMQAAQAFGAKVYAYSPALHIAHDNAGYHIKTPQAELSAKRVVLAMNGYAGDEIHPWLRARTMPVQSNILVTRPLTPDELSAQGWTTDQMAYDTRELLHYFRLLPDRRFLFGMRGAVRSSSQADQKMKSIVRRHFERMFPAWAHVESPFSWSGMLCLSAELVPFCGEIPGQPGMFAGFAYHGNGVAMGTYVGALLSALVQDKPAQYPLPDVMRHPPRRFPLGRHRRLLLYPTYWGAGLADL